MNPAPPQSPESANSANNDLAMGKPFPIDSEMLPLVEKLMASMVLYKVTSKDMDPRNVKSSHIYELARKTGVEVFDPSSSLPNTPLDLLHRLAKFGAFSNVFHRKLSFMDRNVARPTDIELQSKAFSEKDMFPGSTAGMSPSAVIYMSRTTAFTPDERGKRAKDEKKKKPKSATGVGSPDDGPEDEADAAPTKEMLEKLENSVIAQRKVAKALFQMCANETMLFHFVTKGGIEAINRLVRDSADAEVSPVICPAVTRPPPLPVTAP
jgi:hypothetical protein